MSIQWLMTGISIGYESHLNKLYIYIQKFNLIIFYVNSTIFYQRKICINYRIA
jgi:hypothetical protein